MFRISRVKMVFPPAPAEKRRLRLRDFRSYPKSHLSPLTLVMWACGGLYYSATIEWAFLTASLCLYSCPSIRCFPPKFR